MELRAFAEAILFGPNLEEKLTAFDTITDARPGPAVQAPVLPARSAALQPRERLRNIPRNLEASGARGELLHFFANHELLALETMALALLRFPEAPRRFRLGLAAVMRDEQKHLRLYLNRMRAQGVQLGDFELNDYFWRMLRDVGSPLDYAVRMSLTFEQANLDFAHFYREAFRMVGDEDTVAVLDTVLVDEISHVKRGFAFFEEQRPGLRDAWSEYRALLPASLDACRARGNVFVLEPRRAAGLPNSFIQQLRDYRRSRGRPPHVFLFDPFVESDLAASGPARRSTSALRLALELSACVAFFARHEDIVLGRNPSRAFCERLERCDFPVPEFTRLRELLASSRKLSGVHPWGWTPRLERKLAPLLERIVGPTGEVFRRRLAETRSQRASVIGKDAAHRMEEQATGQSVGHWTVCRNRAEATEALARLHALGRTAVLRPVVGSSGRGQRRFAPGTQLGRMAYPVVAEPLEDRLCDFSMHFEITEQEVTTVGWTRQWVSESGAYLGSLVGRLFSPEEFGLFSPDGGSQALATLRDVRGRLFDAGRQVAEQLRDLSFRGPLGIDAFLYRSFGSDRIELRSICDINLRRTMGRLALEVARRMQSGRTGLLLQLHRRDLRGTDPLEPAGSTSPFAPLCEALPPEVVATPRRLMARGLLPVSDAFRARRHALVFVVGRSPIDCVEQIEPFVTAEFLQRLEQNRRRPTAVTSGY